MRATTKKIILILFACLYILSCIIDISKSIINPNSKIDYRALILIIFLNIILIILSLKNVTKNRNSIAVLGVFSAFIKDYKFSSLALLVIFLITIIPTHDQQYQKPIMPKAEPVNTCKTIFYIIFFSIVYIFFYCGLFSQSFVWLNLTQFAIDYSILINAVMFLIMLLVIFFTLKKEIIRDVKLFFKNFLNYFNTMTPVFLLSFITQIAVGLLVSLITKVDAANQINVNSMPAWFLIIFAVIIGPAVEEGFFRGFIRKFIKNDAVFIIVSSLLFSLMHVLPYAFFSPIQFLFIFQYATIAFPISYIYVKTNNLAASYFFHLCWNLITLLFSAMALFV